MVKIGSMRIHNGLESAESLSPLPLSADEMIECQGIKYFIGKKIGQGSSGEVYACLDE